MEETFSGRWVSPGRLGVSALSLLSLLMLLSLEVTQTTVHELWRGGSSSPLYDDVRVYILVCDWVPARKENAETLCSALSTRGVACTLVPAPRGDELSEADLVALEREGVISRASPAAVPFPGEAALRSALPPFLRPLLPERLPNQLNASFNWRANRAAGNTVGALRCAQAMAAEADRLAAAASAAEASGQSPTLPDGSRTLWVYLEDDAVVSDLDGFKPRLLAAASSLRSALWDLLSLAPPPGLCERLARLPFPLRVERGGTLAPRLSFSRTTGVAFSLRGVRALLAHAPATSVIDMWIRGLMRARQLDVRVHCDDIVTFGDVAKTQARRRLGQGALGSGSS